MVFGNRPGVSSNSYANGHHQNLGNAITDRSSTRRLAPPGGASQISFA
jgi:SPIRAL1-like protein